MKLCGKYVIVMRAFFQFDMLSRHYHEKNRKLIFTTNYTL